MQSKAFSAVAAALAAMGVGQVIMPSYNRDGFSAAYLHFPHGKGKETRYLRDAKHRKAVDGRRANVKRMQREQMKRK